MQEIGLGVVLFTTIVMALVGIVLAVRSRVAVTGTVQLIANDREPITTGVGAQLLEALAEAGIQLPSGCGGKGTCGQCRVEVLEGGGAILPIELAHVTKREARAGTRLACQVSIKQDMTVHVPDEILDVEQRECRIRSTDSVTPMIKELVLELPAGEQMDFRSGSYVQITAPPHSLNFTDFDIAANYQDDWDRHDHWRYNSTSKREETRGYSMANPPKEDGLIMLDVRLALPPPGASDEVPPGIVSSYIFSLKQNDTVRVAGPFGHFFIADTQSEMIFVGGGAGMAPMRSHIMDQLKRLKTTRKISYWYGARSRRELFYVNDFDALQAEHDNFKWTVALSDARPDDNWTGRTGFIHEVLYQDYLKEHAAPEDCEYYICGPPMMLKAVLRMLDNLGVDPDTIFYDDFGG